MPGRWGRSTMLKRMKNRCRYTAAVARVSCGSFSMMPTCMMKLTPLLRLKCSASSFIPSSTDGARVSSSSVKSHWACFDRRTGFDGAGTGRCSRGWDVEDAMKEVEGVVQSIPCQNTKVGFKVFDRDPTPHPEGSFCCMCETTERRVVDAVEADGCKCPSPSQFAQTNTSQILNRSRHPWPGRLLIASSGGSGSEMDRRVPERETGGSRRTGVGDSDGAKDRRRKKVCRRKPPPLYGVKGKRE